MKMWLRLAGWLWGWLSPSEPLWKSCRVNDLPGQLRRHCVYLVSEDNQVWQVALLCPCGCGDLIQLCALPGSSPTWEVTEHPNGTVTLTPSVWRTTGCRSHFFVRSGRIQWC